MDRIQMQQVALHLCTNSLDAMPKGGELTVTSRYADHSWIFTVRDTGMGIPEADQARIFEPFFTTKEVGQGTGLGLSTSYQIVQDHKGHILFESHPGEGTSFLVELPLSA
jgi:signal transduction histidine kinase